VTAHRVTSGCDDRVRVARRAQSGKEAGGGQDSEQTGSRAIACFGYLLSETAARLYAAGGTPKAL